MKPWLLLVLLAPSLAASPRRDYERAHREATRELTIYRDFSTALVLRATWLDPELRQALAAERERLVNPSPADQAEFVARSDRDAAEWHEIVFAADSALENADKFGPGDDRWNLRLLADGVEEALVTIERVRRPSPLHAAVYPQLDKWSDLWIARFERTIDRPQRLVLIVGSGYGNGKLVWE